MKIGRGHFVRFFWGVEGHPYQQFWLSSRLFRLQLCHWNFRAKSVQLTFYVYIQDSVENRKFVLLSPLGGLRGNVGLSAQAMSKGRRRIAIGRNWRHFASCYNCKDSRKTRAELQRSEGMGTVSRFFLGDAVIHYPQFWHHTTGNWLHNNFFAESFYMEKLCSRLFCSELQISSKNR